MRTMRLAMTRWWLGGREVPVPMRESSFVVGERRKKRAGTEPHVRGAMKDAIAVRPG